MGCLEEVKRLVKSGPDIPNTNLKPLTHIRTVKKYTF
jgi:hypothetical protein